MMGQSRVARNADVDWDAWPVEEYLQENYAELHAADRAVIAHHSAALAGLAPGSIDRGVEIGAGPNLYPLMLTGAACRAVDAFEPSAANLAYLRRQLQDGPDAHWAEFFAHCREANPQLPSSMETVLARIRVVRGGVLDVGAGKYGLASMNFVAESVTESAAEFRQFCEAFISAVRPGGVLVASFMENMARYRIAGGQEWPGHPVDSATVADVFSPHVIELEVSRIPADPGLPDWGYTGMVLLSARRAG
ncbi:NNMT/PNMT/TEMT family protein [Asanoa ferruginea]|uniref:NNMT/PNMT/TEMT family protein n=2 Tax=Asanoa ferruginea TaxID=53367 RepID=A0A3D9ZBH5_9ACTN|nr:NNMT/PNMT/TEMT family protein [Asanoa ferruginea]